MAGRRASTGVTTVVAALDGFLAVGDGVSHGAAGALADLGWVAALATSHADVLGVLVKGVSKAVTNQDTLEVDVGVWVRQNLRSISRNIVSGIRLASNVKVLLGVLRELLEEESEEGINVLAGGDGAANAVTVRVASVDGLVKEDDIGLVVPRVLVVLGLYACRNR